MALAKMLTNTYRPLGQQDTTGYCVAYVDEYSPDLRRAVIRLAAYDGACSKSDRGSGSIKPFDPRVRREVVTGETFDAYFGIAAMENSNLLRQAYLCLTRSIQVQATESDGTLKVDGDGNPVLVETNAWAGLPEV